MKFIMLLMFTQQQPQVNYNKVSTKKWYKQQM